MATTVRGAKFEVVERLSFSIEMCIVCGVPMALEDDYVRERRRDHASFYCPNGHGQSYASKSREEELSERLAAKQKDIDGALERLRTSEQARSALQDELAKKARRAHNGVCPECKRSFANVANHMKSKHGTAEEAEAVANEHKS